MHFKDIPFHLDDALLPTRSAWHWAKFEYSDLEDHEPPSYLLSITFRQRLQHVCAG